MDDIARIQELADQLESLADYAQKILQQIGEDGIPESINRIQVVEDIYATQQAENTLWAIRNVLLAKMRSHR